jgi:hypothetical protein
MNRELWLLIEKAKTELTEEEKRELRRLFVRLAVQDFLVLDDVQSSAGKPVALSTNET